MYCSNQSIRGNKKMKCILQENFKESICFTSTRWIHGNPIIGVHASMLNSWEPNRWSSRQYVECMGNQSLEFTSACWIYGNTIVGVDTSMLNSRESNRWGSHQYVELMETQSLVSIASIGLGHMTKRSQFLLQRWFMEK